MPKVIVDDALRSELDGHDAPVEVCDQSGRTLGHFVPVSATRHQQIALDDCPYTEEELARMQRETGGRALEEIWKGLRRT